MSDGDYRTAYEQSLSDPDGFWGEAAKSIDWIQPPAKVLDDSNPPFYRWFTGGTLNTCFNALDRHVAAGHGARTALVYDSPVTGTSRT
ncbi:MAG TPA: acetyl-coenzyme A synthetase N-terminal domain-containing protein, partial [Dermatophilaceae bacterium]|nr:acetyl-coenzyme A synthetase N-terminal domain-containing protein [Dermatophilaceae bacterium]